MSAKRKPNRPVPHRRHPVNQLYLSVMAALDARRIELGLSHDELCGQAGIGPRRWSGMLRPPGWGRQAHWVTLGKVVNVLYPRGTAFEVRIEPMLGCLPPARITESKASPRPPQLAESNSTGA